jgi:uncharacterized repeat protein (TIGR02543 family)
MKKVLVFLALAVALVLCLVSCGHEHSFDEWTTTKAPSCSQDGEQERACSCGEVETRAIMATGHKWTEATCKAPKTCSGCGKTEGSALEHNWTEATCTTPKTCLNCKKTEGLPNGHKFGNWDTTVVPTCVDAGEMVRVCSSCELEEKISIKPIISNHKPVTDPAVSATCTEDGLTEGSHCELCPVIIKAQEVIPAKGHTKETVPGYDSTCTKTGLTNGEKCSVCGDTLLEQKEIPLKDHAFDDEYDGTCNNPGCPFERDPKCRHSKTEPIPGYPATCTVDGYESGIKCSDCQETLLERKLIKAPGHTEEPIPAVPATCYSTGLTAGIKCKVCGDILKAQETTRKLNHTPAKAVEENRIEATCTKNGSYDLVVYCSVEKCKYKISSENKTIYANGHTEVIDPAVEPTYTTTGLTEGSHCSVCLEVIVKQIDVPVLEKKEYTITYVLSGGKLNTDLNSYNTDVGVSEEDMPKPTRDGYDFAGWYTTAHYADESIIRIISKGTKEDYCLYAKWNLVDYRITYVNVFNDEPDIKKYTIKDTLKLKSPEWSGLIFTHWSDEDGNIYTPTKDTTFFPPNMSGDLILTANWKTKRNIVTPAPDDAELFVVFSPDEGMIYFFYDLGTIEHVVLDNINSNTYYKSGDFDHTFTLSKTVSVSEETAKSISDTISQSISKTSAWEESYKLAQSHSDHWNAEIGGGINAGIGGGSQSGASGELGAGGGGLSGKLGASLSKIFNWSVNLHIEGSYNWGEEDTTSEDWGQSESYSENLSETQSHTVNSSLAYKQEITSSISETNTIGKELPDGYYAYVHAGNIRVIGIVTYEIATGYVYLNTYSRLDNMHAMIMYSPPDKNELNNPVVEELDFKISEEHLTEIENVVNNSYYIKYEAVGGSGTMSTTKHTIGKEEKLPLNTFTKKGYIFAGWEMITDDGIQVLQDGQTIKNLGDSLETVTLQAKWVKEKAYVRDGDYIYFGDYPQTIKDDSVTITSIVDSRGYYRGSDGYYYAKVIATPYESGYTFSTGASVTDGAVYYFKVEPIRWRILSEKNGVAFILCDSIIANVAYQPDYYYEDYGCCTIANGAPRGTDVANYKYSNVRAWLNSTFYETAFDDLSKSLILTTVVDNSLASTTDSSNPYICENTNDKVFLLSQAEATNRAYGFLSSTSYDTARKLLTSDYTRATGAWMSTLNDYESEYGNGWWWLRTPKNDNKLVRTIGDHGFAYNYHCFVSHNYTGVVPALRITLEP